MISFGQNLWCYSYSSAHVAAGGAISKPKLLVLPQMGSFYKGGNSFNVPYSSSVLSLLLLHTENVNLQPQNLIAESETSSLGSLFPLHLFLSPPHPHPHPTPREDGFLTI